MEEPLVSCLCVTHHHVDLLKRSVDYFQAQTYSHKELVILHRDDNTAADDFVKSLKDQRIIHVIVPAEGLTLGERRNIAIDRSNGFYFCNWDDDDWMHSSRLERQVRQLRQSGKKGNVISNVLIFDATQGTAYLSASRPWEGSILCERSVVNSLFRYEELRKGEDSVFIARLVQEGLLSFTEHPYLYIYCYHGGNTWGRQHWEDRILKYAMKLPVEMNRLVNDIVSDRYSCAEASVLLDEWLERQR